MEALLYENGAIKWTTISMKNRNLPRDFGVFTPVYDNEEWVSFNTETWGKKLSLDQYRGEVDGACVEEEALALGLVGTTDG